MSCDFFNLPHSAIQTLIPYQPGKSIASLQQELGLKHVIKLASNENPLGCSQAVRIALSEMDAFTISTYPAPFHHPFHAYLAAALGIPQQQLLFANGSDALISLLMTTFVLHTHKHILTHVHAFNAFTIQAQALGIPAHVATINDDWSVNIDKLIDETSDQTGLIFIANPNNPTGLAISPQEIKRLLQHIPETTLLVLDEAYFGYYPQNENTLDWLKSFPNLVILRTFSKIYGLAGLRIGYTVAHPDIIKLLQRVQLPFTVNQAAMVAAMAAFKDTVFLQRTAEMNQLGYAQLLAGFKQLKVTPIPSRANFITIDCHQLALPVYEKLLQHGIIVRPLAPYGLAQHLRITIGTPEQNSALLRALADCL